MMIINCGPKYDSFLKESNYVAISSARLNTLLRLHLRPIKVIVSHQLTSLNLGVGFVLRCFQRLSMPNLATQQCRWRDNWYTRG